MKSLSPLLLPALILLVCRFSLAQGIKILTNHVGYETNGPKQAVILGHPNDTVTSCVLLDAQTGRPVITARPVKVGPVDQWHDWIFWTFDFTPVKSAGVYVIDCSTSQGDVRSPPFPVQQKLLERATLSDVVYFFKDQRIVGQTDKADRHLQFEGSADPNKRMDLHGGWADATGDSGIHLSHLNFSTYFNPQHGPLTTWALYQCYDLLRAQHNEQFHPLAKRMLDEAIYGADYLARCKNATGSFFRSVDDNGENLADRFVAKDGSGGIIKKTKNPNPLQSGDMSKISDEFLYEVGFRCGGAMTIAALARASTYPVSGDYSTADYLKAARDGFAFLKKFNLYYTNDGKENIIDDYCVLMAATELFKATGEASYQQEADQRARNLIHRLVTSGNYTNYWRADDGDRPFFHAADAGLPVVSLLNYYNVADESMRSVILSTMHKEMTFELNVTSEVPNPFGYARQLVQSKNSNRRTVFFFPHDTDAAPWWQGEDARLASLATAAHMTAKYFTNDVDFHARLETYAANQLNWILGLNPYDFCMLKGSGRNHAYDYFGAPGGICNGITSGIDNPHDIQFDIDGSRDDNWRWDEQWLPHSTWYMLAVATGD